MALSPKPCLDLIDSTGRAEIRNTSQFPHLFPPSSALLMLRLLLSWCWDWAALICSVVAWPGCLVIYRRGSQGSLCLEICVKAKTFLRTTSDYRHHHVFSDGSRELWWQIAGREMICLFLLGLILVKGYFKMKKNAPAVINCSTLIAPGPAPAENSSIVL